MTFYIFSFSPFHCWWCGAALKLPAVACRAHADVERIYQQRFEGAAA